MAYGATDALECIGFADVVRAPYVPHHGKPIGLQCAFQQKYSLVWLDGGARGQGDSSGKRRVQHVRNFEDVPQNRSSHLGNGRFLKIERERSPFNR